MNNVLYIAVLDEFPDFMTPTLVAHSVLWAHCEFSGKPTYEDWLKNSFKKCVLRVSRAEFNKIAALPDVCLGHENNTLDGQKACAVVLPVPAGSSRGELPNVLKFAKLWKPNENTNNLRSSPSHRQSENVQVLYNKTTIKRCKI